MDGGWLVPCAGAPLSSSEESELFLPSLLDELELEVACFWKVLLVLTPQMLEEGQLVLETLWDLLVLCCCVTVADRQNE